MSAHLIEETLRYLGAADAPEALRRQVAGEAEALSAQFRPRYVYRVWDLDVREDGVCLRGTAVVLRGRRRCWPAPWGPGSICLLRPSRPGTCPGR